VSAEVMVRLGFLSGLGEFFGEFSLFLEILDSRQKLSKSHPT
jgi:hypothetical protein